MKARQANYNQDKKNIAEKTKIQTDEQLQHIAQQTLPQHIIASIPQVLKQVTSLIFFIYLIPL